jgi:transcriptional antiterminator RfaH
VRQWFVAHTQPLKERVAENHLQEQGFQVYCPRYRKIRRHARRTTEVVSPLFPRYLFVALNLELDRWRSVNGTKGISYLLMNDEKPIWVPECVVQDLKEREVEEGIVPVTSLVVFAKGDKVRVKEGAFESHIAVFEELDDKQRVQLLLSVLGREARISLSAYAVEAA